jgi:Ca-activated chloride channel homolog
MPMQFLRPDLAVWLLLLPLVFIFWLIHIKAKYRFRLDAGFGSTLQTLSHFSTSKRDITVLIVASLAVGAIVLAVMRPQLFIDRMVPEYERQDLVLVLDRSASMHARDVPPSRFTRAIQEIKSFLAEKPAEIDRVSLVGFAGTAITLSHLTRDLDTLFFFLDWIGEDPRVYFGTDMTEALTNALELVNKDDALNQQAEATQKIFLILSDGDDQSEKLAGLLDQLQRKQIRVHSIGIGSDTAVPIPVAQEDGVTQYLLDEEGEQLTTQFDETTLRMVADMTGGRYFRSTTGHELADFIGEIVRQEKRQIGLKRSEDYMELHIPLLLLACVASLFLLVKI